MEISLLTNGQDHYVHGYGKQNIFIITAPLSILKKMVHAHCFEVVQSEKTKEAIPLIKLREDFKEYVGIKTVNTRKVEKDHLVYKLSLCTRKNELLQHYSTQWHKKLVNLETLIYYLGVQHKGYYFGAYHGKLGLQLTILNDALWQKGKAILGKNLYYPFLIKEFEAEIDALKTQADYF